jgi:hypothetical protein
MKVVAHWNQKSKKSLDPSLYRMLPSSLFSIKIIRPIIRQTHSHISPFFSLQAFIGIPDPTYKNIFGNTIPSNFLYVQHTKNGSLLRENPISL